MGSKIITALLCALLYLSNLSAQDTLHVAQFAGLGSTTQLVISGDTISAGAPVYINRTNKKCYRADKAGNNPKKAAQGMALTDCVPNDTTIICYRGRIIDYPIALQRGNTYYLGTTKGTIAQDQPTGENWQELGIAIDTFVFDVLPAPAIPIITTPSLSDVTAINNITYTGIQFQNGTFSSKILPYGLTDNRTVLLPNASGTIALTSNINTYTAGEGIDITGTIIKIDTVDRIMFDQTPTLPGGVGVIRWNDTDGTLEFGMKGGNVVQQIGQELPVLVKHADNSGLANGAVVYSVGSDGTNKTVRLARANSDVTSKSTFGVMTEAATGGSKAFCTTFGLVRELNTAALTEGELIWLSSTTAGAMTSTMPTAPNHAVQVGYCVKSHTTQGIIFVEIQNGYELGELHDVEITSPANGNTLVYNSTTGVWNNAAPSGGGSGTVTSVGLSLPSIITVSNSPVTTSGTLTGTLSIQTANTIFAGPTTGTAIAPTFRTMVAEDISMGIVGPTQLASTAVTAATYGSATQVPILTVDADGRITGVTNTTITAGTGDIVNGGNTTGATVLIGTNDANALSLETNGVVRMSIAGAATTGGSSTQTVATANTATTQDALTIQTNSTGTPAIGFGANLLMKLETSTTDNQDAARISAKWTSATHATRTSNLGISLINSAGALIEQFVFSPSTGLTVSNAAGTSGASYTNSSITTATSYTIGNSTQALTLGGSSGNVTLSTSGVINITPNFTANPLTIGGTTFNSTTIARITSRFTDNFTPAATGTNTFTAMSIQGTINQTGGHTGITRGMEVNPTITAAADYRGIDIITNNSNVKGIYQSGALTTNIFVGKTALGSITAPTSSLTITGANGYTQLRLITQYTPTATADTNGSAGDVSVDDNYIYFKTSTGWKRTALSTF